MKKISITILACAAALTACNKSDVQPVYSDAIVFEAAGIKASVSTKADVVESLDAFNVGCVTGVIGSSETEVWNASFVSDGASSPTYSAGKYWPLNDAEYKFLSSNAALTHTDSGYTVTVNDDKDIVCAVLANPVYKTKNTLTFNHIFARLGVVEVSAASGYTISDISITVTPKTGGTYNLVTGNGHSDGTGWSNFVTGAPVEIAQAVPGSKANDLFLVPGDYELTATWTATRDDYTETFTDKKQTVSLAGGFVTKITAELTGDGTELSFGVTVTPWDSVTTDVTFPIN